MFFFFAPALSKVSSATLLSDLDLAQAGRLEMSALPSVSPTGHEIVGDTGSFTPSQGWEEDMALFLPDPVRDLLADCCGVEQVVGLLGRTEFVRPLYPISYGVSHLLTADDVCGLLRNLGENALADRIAYFASDEDLSEGDIPVTAESARGFLSFWGRARSVDGRISLTCSQEGWICAEWSFPDLRGASLWFLNDDQIMFAATDASGNFIEVGLGSEVVSCDVVTTKLVEAGLFVWSLNRLVSTSSYPVITFSAIADRATSTPTVSHRPTPSSSVMGSLTYPPTGWNTFIPQTDQSKFRELVKL